MPLDLVIDAQGVRKEYGEQVALAGLDLQVRRGEVVGLLGPNGAGKSTLMKVLATLIAPTAGVARVAGFDVVRAPMEVRKRIGYVPERGTLFEALTGDEFLELVIELKSLDRLAARAQASELAEAFEIAGALTDQLGTYSKGRRRKMLIVAALVGEPDVLILDEPTDGLDAPAVVLLRQMLHERSQRGTTVLCCSHDLGFVEKCCDRIGVLAAGALVAGGPVSRIVQEARARTLDDAILRLAGSSRR